ncbi:S-type anion channel [Nymphaea thermarum]|nr:S-type anion channel [Nymphaea thermarum]
MAHCAAATEKQDHGEELPPLFQFLATEPVDGFDEECYQTLELPCTDSAQGPSLANENVADSTPVQSPNSSSSLVPNHCRSISISMPSSPLGAKSKGFPDDYVGNENAATDGTGGKAAYCSNASVKQPNQAMFYSIPIPKGTAYADNIAKGLPPDYIRHDQNGSQSERRTMKSFNSFKTWSGRLERQLSVLRGRQQEEEFANDSSPPPEIDVLPVDRYFDALEGPELETLKDSEELLLPEDQKWPFLLRFPISSFGICLGLSSQAILWKALARASSMQFLHVSPTINMVLWFASAAVVATIATIYSLKIIFYFEAVRREYYHPVRINFFFAPWIACLFLVMGLPPSLFKNLHPVLWYVLMAPIFCLELKLYGQWMSGGQRRLSKVANPSNHLSIVGNFVGALLGATMGLREGPLFFFAIGLAHYGVLFVTLYQRLPTNETLPKELHPVFFLFVAAPSVASMAWARIQGNFDYVARIAYFIALFLYISLAVRINFFRGFRFSLAWWAYTFPMTGASIATIRYSSVVTSTITRALSVVLSSVSSLTVLALLVSTIIHAFVLRDLFPNDIAIAITQKKVKTGKKQTHLRTVYSDIPMTEADKSNR